jgi:hypothetical protein
MAEGRIIVAQPAALCRGGAGLFQVGVLRWMLPPEVPTPGEPAVGPMPMMTVVAKATYSFAGEDDRPLPFAEEPAALSLDLPSELEGAGDEIAYPSDFVPIKPFCDVLIHGHAYAAKPVKSLAASLEVSTLARSFAVESGMPTMRAPLLGKAIRTPDGLVAAAPVGPSATRELVVHHPADFDFATYCTAPEAQRIKQPPVGWKLTLRGLSARADRRVIRIPEAVPIAWVDSDESAGEPVDLWCDTIWIDTDRELLVMVYRGVFQIADLVDDGVSRITLALPVGDELPELRDVQRDLLRGAFEPAVELRDFEDEEGATHLAEEAALEHFALLAEEREPTIALETYAAIAAAAAESPDHRASALAEHGLDDTSYLVEERAWLTRMGDAAMNGDVGLAMRFGELFVAAQDRLAAPGEGKETAAEYAALKVDMDDADDDAAMLAERNMTLPAWMRMERRWAQRTNDDPLLGEEIERRKRAYRASKGAA